ncbi:nitroreductase family protein [Robiginitomaculum antarcticum]|uniref:nitroreductase family protein n=1 Tax=Robiginitomaculum antarcticum TaxID=437507 RepID=UPI000477FCC4|nr:nitroreductase family protein [Robiginitomaculum antarcticum]
MSLTDILASRYSVRGFLPKPVPQKELEDIFAAAQMSASNCNTQPWQPLVVSGDKAKTVSSAMLAEIMSGTAPYPDFEWNVKYQDEHRTRQFGSANALYSAMGIAREDKPARNMAMGRNWQFFGAPHAIFFTMEKYLGIMGAVDVGIYAQTLSLLMKERGIDSCMQGALGQFPGPVKEIFDVPEERGILFGMSFGYADPDHSANQARTDRAPLGDSVRFES